MKRLFLLLVLGLSVAGLHTACAQMPAAPASNSAANLGPGVLHREQAAAILPATVFFRGQTAPIQARNSAGIKFPGGKLLLAAMVDSSGYASAIQQTYQAYLLLETPVLFGGKRLAPGAYGFGFLPGDHAQVMDLGGNTVLEVPTAHDPELKRPTPLQIIEAAGAPYRLYLGREFVTIAAAP